MKGSLSKLIHVISFVMLIGLSTPAVSTIPDNTDGKKQQTTTNFQIKSPLQLTGQTKQVQRELQKLEYTLRQKSIQPNSRRGETENKITLFKQLLSELDYGMRADFAAVKQFIESSNLPELIHQRHAAAQQAYEEKRNKVLSELAELEKNPDTQALLDLIHQIIPAPIEADLTQTAESDTKQNKTRAPYRSKAELEKLKPIEETKVLARRNPPNFRDLAETIDIQITEEIIELAQSLDNNPLKIYRWVYDNIDYIPSHGSIQGSHATYLNRRGNAFDTSNLLIALLRASKIEARYTYGTIKIPAVKLINWIGAPSIKAAVSLLNQGGVPHSVVMKGSAIQAVEMEHMWVHAWVDFEPSRGTLHRTGDTWVALDAAYKAYDQDKGINWEVNAFFDDNAMASTIQSGAKYNDTWVEGIPTVEKILSDYTQVVKGATNQAKNVEELLGQREISSIPWVGLPSGAPYEIIAEISNFNTLWHSMRWHWDFRIYASTKRKIQKFSYITPLPDLEGKSVSLYFKPYSHDDRKVLEALLPEGDLNLTNLPADFPGYLVNVYAAVYLDGKRISNSSGLVLGSKLPVITTYFEAGRTNEAVAQHQYNSFITVGNSYALGYNLQGNAYPAFNKVTKHLAETVNQIDNNETVGDNRLSSDVLGAIAQGWFALHDLYSSWYAAAADVAAFRAPSFANVHTTSDVTVVAGIPTTINFTGVALKVERMAFQSAAKETETNQRWRTRVTQSASSLAQFLLEESFKKEGWSVVRLLNEAIKTGQRVYTFDQEKNTEILATLPSTPSFIDSLQLFLSEGWQVTLPVSPIVDNQRNIWGVAATDPKTGESDHLLDIGEIVTAAVYDVPELAWIGLAPERSTALASTHLNTLKTLTEGLQPTLADPSKLPISSNFLKHIAALRIDSSTGPQLPDVLDKHLWNSLMADGFNINQLIDPEAPTVTLNTSTENAVLGDTITINAGATDNKENVQVSATLNGEPLDISAGTITFTLDSAGLYKIKVSAIDGASNLTEKEIEVLVTDPNDTTKPTVLVDAPEGNPEITAPTDIRITAEDTGLTRWIAVLRPVSSTDPNSQIVIAEGTGAVTQHAITVDPTLLMNGFYHLIVQAEDANGNTETASQTYLVNGDMKVGNFSFSVLDLEIPMMGMPIRVTRTYDTRRKDENLDFGYGWSVDYQNSKVEETRVPGKHWETVVEGGGVYAKNCLRPLGSPQVAVTLPSGQVERFDVVFEPACGNSGQPFHPAAQMVFTPTDGTTSSLRAARKHSTIRPSDDGVYDGAYIIDPDEYILTTQEGYEFYLIQGEGLKQVKDPNGHTLTYSQNGITHSAGKSVQFLRDNAGRIKEVIDPMGKKLRYTRNNKGDLTAVTGRDGYTVSYTYNNRHAMAEIIDPLDRPLIRNVYNDEGRLIAQRDNKGNETRFDHDLATLTAYEGIEDLRKSIVRDRLGNVSQVFYDENGNVVVRIDPEQGVHKYTFDKYGNQLSYTNPLGHTEETTYDEKFRVTSAKDAEGHETKYQYIDAKYDDKGELLQRRIEIVTDANNNTFETWYNDRGTSVQSLHLPNNKTVSLALKSNGLPESATDALNRTTLYNYDQFGNKLSETDPEGNTVAWTYDKNGRQLSKTRQRTINGQLINETTAYSYDNVGRLIKTTYPDGTFTQTEYTALGKTKADIDAAGRRTEYSYDLYGNVIETRYADGTKETRSYNAESNLLSVTGRDGLTTRYEYDKAGRQVKVVQPNGSFTRTVYNLAGQTVEQYDENNNPTAYTYDKNGRQHTITDALGHVTQFAYDKTGNRTAETRPTDDGTLVTTQYVYDALDQLTRTIYPDGLASHTNYDAMGQVVRETNRGNAKSEFSYDKTGHLIAVTQYKDVNTPLVTRFAYNEQGHRISQTDANNHTTTWTYDSFGRVATRTLPEGMSESFVYDAQTGNVIQHTDFNGDITQYSYDETTDQLLRADYADGYFEAYSYDNLGRRKTAENPHGTINYSYDEQGRLQTVSRPNGISLSYDYDNVGNRTVLSVTTPNFSRDIHYNYDALNRLIAVAENGQQTTYSYTPTGKKATVQYPNNTQTNYAYDKLSRLIQLKHQKADGSILASYDYTHTPTGHRKTITEHTGRTFNYDYDELYRLVKETHTYNGQTVENSYQHDNASNVTRSIEDGVHTVYQYDKNDRLQKQGGYTYQYDQNGNILAEIYENQTTRYQWNGAGLLNRVESLTDGAVTATTNYAYDVEGNRTQSSSAGKVINYIVDNNRGLAQVIAETDSSGQLLAAYLHGEDLISQSRAGKANYYHYDGLGSTRILTDSTGAVTDTYTYAAYGQVLEQSGETENNYLYTGEQYDTALDSYYLRARYYSTASKRFLSMDSFAGVNKNPVTLNKYLYGNANPTNFTDPTGLFSLGEMGTASNIRVKLMEIQVDVGLSILDAALNPNADKDFVSDVAVGGATFGAMVLVNQIGKQAPKLLKLFSRKFRKQCKGPNSFDGEVLVSTELGLKPIKDIKIGDLVWAYNEKTGETILEEVTNLIQRQGNYDLVNVVLQDGENILTTKNHPFYIAQSSNTWSWVDAVNLQFGDTLWSFSATQKEIYDINKVIFDGAVYNLTVKNAHTYFVGQNIILTHNADCDIDWIIGDRTVADIAGNTNFIPNTQNTVLRNKVAQFTAMMKNGTFIWYDKVHFMRTPKGKLIIIEGHHRVLASILAGIEIPENARIYTDISREVKRGQGFGLWENYEWR